MEHWAAERGGGVLTEENRHSGIFFDARAATSLQGDPYTNGAWLKHAQKELDEGYEFLDFIREKYPKRVTFFGSGRESMAHSVYKSAERLGGMLAREGCAVISGGNGGIMSAVAKGAYEAGGTTIGFGANVANESPSPYLTHSFRFDNLFVRQELLIRSGNAYVFYPGGFGTQYEFFHLLALMQLARVEKVPLIVIGFDYWNELKQWIRKQLVDTNRTIDLEDGELFTVVADEEEAYRVLHAWFS